MAGYERAASEHRAWLCFEDEAGQGLKRPKGRTWGRRGASPVVKVTARGTHRVSFARLLDAAHQQPGGPIVLVRDNINTHTSVAMRGLIATRAWLTVYRRTRPPAAMATTPTSQTL